MTQSYAACEFFGGDLAQAEALWTDALERLRKVTEDSHPSLLDMWGGLGKIRAKRRDRDGAADAFRKALEMARSHYGDGPKVSIYLNNLGGLELNMGDPAAAETWFRDSLRQPGQDEISTATTRSNLSIGLGKQGKWAEATEQIEEAVRAAREKLGVHPWTARNLFNLGEAYRRQGQLSKAEPVYREACEIVGKLDLGEGNPIAFRNREGLVHSLVGQEKWAEVGPAVRELLKEHGAQHSPAERANWLVTLGRSLLRTGEPARAEAPLREALEIREEALGDHWARYNAMSLLGASLAGQEKHADAEPLLVEAFEKMAPPERLASRREEALERVIALYEAWGKPDEAAAWRAKAR